MWSTPRGGGLMSAIAILLELHRQGIVIDLVGDRIRCRHAPGALTPALATRVRAHRGEVISLLADPDALRLVAAQAIFDARIDRVTSNTPASSEEQPAPMRCWACGLERVSRVTPCSRCHPPACLQSKRGSP